MRQGDERVGQGVHARQPPDVRVPLATRSPAPYQLPDVRVPLATRPPAPYQLPDAVRIKMRERFVKVNGE